ncbi:D-Ala-D-Ala carboxypeptidase family metallohydrolase [Tenacibaculum dicentrarchi]|nr:D-Ala-D-Ala carboxypeptidase family metallohydrolase [Tenacibaculum dicentrarchi]MCD8443071.1 D-Ala-D-Ala carboxypeptidase family metallohydrolase [Tenacibaculum dicentrarchi]MCD8449930.1 D-Ala-D-Ala carboxypeptidase family metallohydrolase [Tenacibaculum dicentrarchi]
MVDLKLDNVVKTPYLDKYGKFVKKIDLYANTVTTEFNDSFKVSENLTLGELRKSSFVTSEELKSFSYVPIDKRVLLAFEVLRKALGKPIYLTSSFRSYRHELSKGRKGTSQHVQGKALDLVGDGLVALVSDAIATKNSLFVELQRLGVNGFGIYKDKNFVHIDVRDASVLGNFAFWGGSETSEKKKSSIGYKTVLTIVGIVLSLIGIFLKLKDWRR